MKKLVKITKINGKDVESDLTISRYVYTPQDSRKIKDMVKGILDQSTRMIVGDEYEEVAELYCKKKVIETDDSIYVIEVEMSEIVYEEGRGVRIQDEIEELIHTYHPELNDEYTLEPLQDQDFVEYDVEEILVKNKNGEVVDTVYIVRYSDGRLEISLN